MHAHIHKCGTQVNKEGLSPLDIATSGNNGVLMDMLARAADAVADRCLHALSVSLLVCIAFFFANSN